MRRRIRITRYTKQILDALGGPEKVINNMLRLCENGDIEFMNKEPINTGETEHVTLNVNITNLYYISLVAQYGEHNNKMSLARFVEWFCAEELYSIYDVSNDSSSDRHVDKILSNCAEIINAMNKVSVSSKHYKSVTKLSRALKEFLNEYEQERRTEN